MSKRKITKSKTDTRRFVVVYCDSNKGTNYKHTFRVTNLNQAIRFVKKANSGYMGFSYVRSAYYSIKNRSDGKEIRFQKFAYRSNGNLYFI
jgi:hypothetical protein